MNKVTLSPPWITYRHKINTLFDLDPAIEVGEVQVTNNEYSLTISVSDHEKFIAMLAAMPSSVDFGNVKLIIRVVDATTKDDPYRQIYETLFKGNPRVKDIKDVVDFAGTPHTFIRFQPEVLQFFHDDISDFNGNWSGLAQDIARELFTAGGVTMHFCTADLRENSDPDAINHPLGEWP